MKNLGKQLLVIAFIAYPVVLHAFILNQHIQLWQLVLAFAPLLASAVWLLFRWTARAWWPVLLLALTILIYFVYQQGHGLIGLLAINGLFHALLNLSMLWLFGITLLQGREPLITQIARRISGELTEEIRNYTRQATVAWCILFTMQVVISLLLYVFAPLAVWSFFINVLDFPILALMFIAEFSYRTLRFPDHPRISIMKIIHVFRNDFSVPQNSTKGSPNKQTIV
jgi:uncharacterized membrane protein